MKSTTILIVDDQKEVIRMIASELKSKNPDFRIINAINGEIGYNLAITEAPDVIIMDWDMPVMDGIETTKKLRRNELTDETPIIMATGQMTSSEDLKIALEAGATDYIRKPVDFIELTARINTALSIRSHQLAIRELLKSEIDLKSRQLSTTSMLIVEKNTFLQQFHVDLEKLENSINDPSGKLKELRKQISSLLEVDDSWDTFKLHFEEVNPHFFSEIKKLAADLSHKDLKLCAYVKLGMDNKQIASLLNISPGSARTALTRLKKKLGIDEEVNLREVIDQVN